MNEQPKGVECLKFNPLLTLAILFERLSALMNNKIGLATKDDDKGNREILFKLVANFDPVLFENECEDDGASTKDLILMDFYFCHIRNIENKGELFNKILSLYYKNFKSFSKVYKWKYFTDLHNIGYALAHNLDYTYYGQTVSLLSDFVLSEGIYSANEDDYLLAIAFEYIFNLKFVFLETEELKKFIETYSVKAHPERIAEVKTYAYAFYFFKKREFNKSLECISSILPQDWKKNILHKLKIAVLYEMKVYEEAFYSIDTYEHFIRNHKSISDSIRFAGLKFTNAIRKLIKASTNSIPLEPVDIKNIIDENKNSHFGFWIKEKAEELVVIFCLIDLDVFSLSIL